MIGTKLAHYEITAHLGKCGMGEVHQATDSKLGRTVAIKCLPDAFLHDVERVSRFQREARVLASLNHSNIAGIYGVEETAERHFLVMEYVPGDTLADRIEGGAVPVDEGIEIARQIAEALEAAHEKGVLHRDLKPANIKITPDGKVKVLDFGLAKVFTEEPLLPMVSNSPTMMSVASIPGVILGTAAYMSPEQSRGKQLDARTDVWAFGVLLFEMLTGGRAFAGETTTDILAAIVHEEPEWERLPAETPQAVRRLLRRCLAKDVRHRLHAIADARLEIESALSDSTTELPTPLGRRISGLVIGLVAVAVALATFVAVRWFASSKTTEPTRWTSIVPPEKSFSLFSNPGAALSPDGRLIAFTAPNAAGKDLIWVRPLDSPTAHALSRTDDASGIFWSPDNRSLGFFAQGKLARVDIAGGSPQVLANAPVAEGGSWASDGTILFVPNATNVYRVPAWGGNAVEVTHLNSDKRELIHGWPSFLPDQKHFLVWVFSSDKQNEGVFVG